MNPELIRQKTFGFLESRGFKPAHSLPLPETDAKLRPTQEIVLRLMALDALFTYVSAPEEIVLTSRVEGYIERNQLVDALTEQERSILSKSRGDANNEFANIIGWKLENMWPLAWVLGFVSEPTIEAAFIDDDITRAMNLEFMPNFDSTAAQFMEKIKPRTDAEVVNLEYLFYCAHNAVRSAQLGGKTVPDGFHPVMHGGVIHERRHALTWCLAPETSWEDTDLST